MAYIPAPPLSGNQLLLPTPTTLQQALGQIALLQQQLTRRPNHVWVEMNNDLNVLADITPWDLHSRKVTYTLTVEMPYGATLKFESPHLVRATPIKS